MCDYSLCGLPNRLAVEGEELVVHRFRSGSTGLTSPDSGPAITDAPAKGFWSKFKNFLLEDNWELTPVTAVCVPPGAQLILENVPEDLQDRWRIEEEEEVFFVQINASAYNYRDAIRIRTGEEILLQNLSPGMRVHVVSLGNAAEGVQRDLAVPVL